MGDNDDRAPECETALVPTGRQLKSYACVRSLERKGIPTITASTEGDIPQFASRYCSERTVLPSGPDDPVAYKDSLLELAAHPDVLTAIPVREIDAFVLAKYRDEFEDHVSLVTPRLATLERAHDRLRLAREAERAGVPYAETRLLSDVDEWDGRAIVKSRYNILTGEYVDDYPADHAEEVKQIWSLRPGERPDVDAVREAANHEPIVQEFVPQADKHLYCALWDEGEPLATYQHRQLRQNSWVGGGGVYRESTHSRAVEDVAYDLLSHLEWTGFACIEYVEDAETGEWTFLEINPRVWQSLPETVRAGADFPYYYWLRARGEPERIDPAYDVGVRCHIAYGEVAHLLSILRDDSPLVERPSFARTMLEIAGSCLAHPRFDYIRSDDPGLFLSCIRDTLSTGVTSSRQYNPGDSTSPTSGREYGHPRDPSANPAAAEHEAAEHEATERDTTEHEATD